MAELAHRELQVLAARRMPVLDTEALVALRIAGRDEHVVDGRGVVGLERQDRAPAVGDEGLAHLREQMAHTRARVHGAVVLADVSGVEGEQVGHLLPLDVDDAERLPSRDGHRPALRRRDVDDFPGPHGPSFGLRAARSQPDDGQELSNAFRTIV